MDYVKLAKEFTRVLNSYTKKELEDWIIWDKIQTDMSKISHQQKQRMQTKA